MIIIQKVFGRKCESNQLGFRHTHTAPKWVVDTITQTNSMAHLYLLIIKKQQMSILNNDLEFSTNIVIHVWKLIL